MRKDHARSCLLALLWVMVCSSTAYAQADADGTLYVYADKQGKEVVSASPRQDLEFVERIRPQRSHIKATRSSKGSSLATRMEPYLELVQRIAPEHGLDPVFVLAIISAESGFDPQATSRVGAMGLMQIMPSNARRFEADDPYDPEQNVTAGCMLLARLHERYDGDVPLILAAYSAGDVHVKKAGGVPKFSIKYIARVVRAHARITRLLQEG